METAPPSGPDTSEDWLIDVAERYLRRGLLLKARVDRLAPTRGYRETFSLTREINPPNFSYGFFDSIEAGGRTLPVMGNVQEMAFDCARSHREIFDERRQLREFVLRYFMRVSDFRVPDVYVDDGRPSSAWWPQSLSWCARRPAGPREGFGFSQLMAKRAGSGTIERFPPGERFAIIDLREIGNTYDWLIAKVQIFDFAFRFSVPRLGVDVAVPLNEDSYLVLSPEFITDDPHNGRFGLGYAFVRNRDRGALAYGPGEFDAAFEQIDYSIQPDGQVRVRMHFAANRPSAIARVSLDPIMWLLRGVDVASAGAAREILDAFEADYRRLDLTWPSIDPVYTLIALANVLTLGQAAEQACISTDQPDRLFLAQHFQQHYQAITGSLATWRHVPDWCDERALPDWVRTGVLA